MLRQFVRLASATQHLLHCDDTCTIHGSHRSGLKLGTDSIYNDASDITPELGCEMRIIGSIKPKVGLAETTRCVGVSYTVAEFDPAELNNGPTLAGKDTNFILITSNHTNSG